MSKRLLLISSSSQHKGAQFLQHAEAELRELLEGKTELIFIPYSRPGGISHKEYSQFVKEKIGELNFNINVRGIESFDDPKEAILNAEAVFVGGGNTFRLVTKLYELDLMDTLRERALGGMPYIGSSAGSNITGINLCTTNDMPIVYPPSFDTLGLVPFNINPHFIPAESHPPDHSGETREKRIGEFHSMPQNTQTVIGIREDSMLVVRGDSVRFFSEKESRMRIFRQNEEVQLKENGYSFQITDDSIILP